jgi:hypothetical protein
VLESEHTPREDLQCWSPEHKISSTGVLSKHQDRIYSAGVLSKHQERISSTGVLSTHCAKELREFTERGSKSVKEERVPTS